MMYYIYVLSSIKDGENYVGYTKNLKLRFEKHQKGEVASTINRRPLKLIYYEACLNQQDATHREKYLKTHHGKMFLKNRLKSYLTGWTAFSWFAGWLFTIGFLELPFFWKGILAMILWPYYMGVAINAMIQN